MNQDNQSSSGNVTDAWSGAVSLQRAARAEQTATDIWDDCVTRFLGINRTDGRCLDIIDLHGRVTAGQLAAESGLTTGAVTVAVDRLEKAGYVERTRDTEDRRKVWIAMTDTAKAINRLLFSHFSLIGPAIVSQFTPQEIAAIVRFLEAGARINIEQAKVLERHVDRNATTLEERMNAARAFERDGRKSIEALLADLASKP